MLSNYVKYKTAVDVKIVLSLKFDLESLSIFYLVIDCYGYLILMGGGKYAERFRLFFIKKSLVNNSITTTLHIISNSLLYAQRV